MRTRWGNPRIRFESIVAFLLLLSSLSCQAQGVGSTCNLFDSSATFCKPLDWQYDKICEADRLEESCTDCFDCDSCRAFDFDCEACVSNGCYWCAGDALCSSEALTQNQWDHLQKGLERSKLYSSCVVEQDWQAGTCASNATEAPIFSDPLIASMTWLYDMVRVQPVWEAGILGKGIRVRVNDVGGVEATHAEFSGRFDEEHSCENYLPDEATMFTSVGQHGTAVASMALGGANNDQCSAGIAPEATLSACTLPTVANPFEYATIMILNLEAIDISVNSWSLDSCFLKEQIARERRKQRRLQETTTCPFSTEFSNSPCQYCGDSLSTMTDDSQLDSNCRIAIALHCTTRFEHDEEACSEFLSVYAECSYDSTLSKEERAALEIGVQQGRGGKGIIFVMSAGNNYKYGDSTNGQRYTNSRYTISVAAVDKDGFHASYSAIGSSLFVSAPGGDVDHLTNNIVAKNGGGCHDIRYGTSFSAPVVAGIVALLLEVNPELSWRDIQAILASTSRQVDIEDDSWVINSAGFHHSYRYGFGIADAEAAVEAARSWVPWGPEEFVVVESDLLNLPIPEHPDGDLASTTLLVSLGDDITVETESVVVFLSIEHPSRGDLNITLTSPQGSESILHRSPRPENTHVDSGSYWELMTVRAWGENPQGEWTLSIRDAKPGNLADDCVDVPWSLTLLSSPEAPAGAQVTCSSIERSQTCANGALVNQNLTLLINPESQLSPDQACCVCGGGMTPTKEARLISWTLVVYGRTVSGTPATEEPASGGGEELDVASGEALPYARHVFWQQLSLLYLLLRSV